MGHDAVSRQAKFAGKTALGAILTGSLAGHLQVEITVVDHFGSFARHQPCVNSDADRVAQEVHRAVAKQNVGAARVKGKSLRRSIGAVGDRPRTEPSSNQCARERFRDVLV